MILPVDKLFCDVMVTLGVPGPTTPVMADGDTVTVTPLLVDPPGPTQITVYEVVVVSAPVPNEPVGRVPPPPDDVQEVLFVEFQLIVLLEL